MSADIVFQVQEGGCVKGVESATASISSSVMMMMASAQEDGVVEGETMVEGGLSV
jgi:hypothetical protein